MKMYSSKFYSFIAGVDDTSEQLIPGVVDTGDKLSFGNTSENFPKTSKRGLGDTDS
jgi:hypothetical protein